MALFSKKAEQTPEQEKAEVDSLIDRIGSSIEQRIEAKFKPITDDITALKTKWDDIEKSAREDLERQSTTPKDENGNPRQLTDDEKRNSREMATVQLAVQTNARLTESEIIDEIKDRWSHLVPEIRTQFAATPIQRKAQPDYAIYCRNVVDMIVGREARKGGLSYDSQNKTFFLEDKTTGATESSSPLNDPGLVWRQQMPDGSTRVLSASDQLRKLGIDAKELEANIQAGKVNLQ